MRGLLQIGASVSAVSRIAERLRENPDLNVNRMALRRASDSLAAQVFRSHPLRLERPDEDFEWQFLDPNRPVAQMSAPSQRRAEDSRDVKFTKQRPALFVRSA